LGIILQKLLPPDVYIGRDELELDSHFVHWQSDNSQVMKSQLSRKLFDFVSLINILLELDCLHRTNRRGKAINEKVKIGNMVNSTGYGWIDIDDGVRYSDFKEILLDFDYSVEKELHTLKSNNYKTKEDYRADRQFLYSNLSVFGNLLKWLGGLFSAFYALN
jgi:hypothetical protein